ncbi:glycerophosphodiester phosphodiesterase family protein [Ekhidna sp.]|uniref:glycerophosphodiester phosphodiesterase family protein n=1 Tax=Ekhidna sp. TaxID=2608089 RepID=UPI003CCBB130
MRIWSLFIMLIFGCAPQDQEVRSIDIQGHRGARGLAPENSIPAFILATELGVTTLEMDVVISKDDRVVVSHEPYFSPIFCLDSEGNKLPEDSVINLYKLNYSEIRAFDCGSSGNEKYPEQKKIAVYKPLLKNVIDTVESFTQTNQLNPIQYNIELKSKRKTEGEFHPYPENFSDLVYGLLKEQDILNRVTIQSFDFRILQYFNQKYPDIKLVLLIENELDWAVNVDSLGFNPEVYSPYYPLLSRAVVKEIQDAGMKVVPWTVNEPTKVEQLIAWGVDGIITDYPDRALRITNNDE